MSLLWAVILLFAVPCWPAQFSEVRSSATPLVFVKTESFALPRGARNPTVAYGNEEIGFFLQRNPAVRNGRVEITLVPPTYRRPISFELRYEGADGRPLRSRLGERRYTSPSKINFQTPAKVVGRFSFPFFLVNAVLGRTEEEQFAKQAVFVPAIVNRFGEVVWYSSRKADVSVRSILMEPAGNGRYYFLKRDRHSELRYIDYTGKVLREVDFQKAGLPPNSHSFKLLPETGELLYLSYDCRELPWHKEFAPLFSGPAGWWRLLTLPRRSYRGGRLIRLKVETGEAKEIWRTHDHFSPSEFPSLYSVGGQATDRFQDARTAEQYRQFLLERGWFSSWGEFCDVDWTHENSVDYRPGEGYLISIRNLNLLVFVREDGKLAWKLGEDPRAEYRLPSEQAFSMQHSASFLPNGDILLYDNNAPFRGSLGRRRNNRIMVIRKPGAPGLASVAFTAPLEAPQSLIRGSSSALPNGSYFAYIPGAPGTREVVVEVNPARPTPMPRLEFGGDVGIRGIEAKPLFAIGTEELLHEESPKARAPSPAEALSPDQLIDTTY